MRNVWDDISDLPKEGRFLVLNARNGDMWVSSYSGKPWKWSATHWGELPPTSETCEAWKSEYIRLYGVLAFDEMMLSHKNEDRL